MKWCKRFLNLNSQYVDFISASFIIAICLVVLLPKVHDSFRSETSHFDNGHLSYSQGLRLSAKERVADKADEDHRLPIGEIIICLGFFVFYCLDIGLSRDAVNSEDLPILNEQGRVPVVCCPSTRCPTSQRELPIDLDEQETKSIRSTITSPDDSHSIGEKDDDGCLMLLNRHHNHHVHSHHHDHNQHVVSKSSNKSRKTGYGSLNETDNSGVDPQKVSLATSLSGDDYDVEKDCDPRFVWPTSVRLTLFALIMAAILILFDLNVRGFIHAMQVFRAAATGALLYIALYLILPRTHTSCRYCTEEVA